MSDFKSLYRIEKLARVLECGPAKAADVNRTVCARLSDAEFEKYTRDAAEALTTLRARAGQMPSSPTRAADPERTRASISQYMDWVYGLNRDDEE